MYDEGLVDQLDDKTYVLTATRTRVTWRVPRGAEMVPVGKRFKKGQKIVGIPEAQLHRLVALGHAVPEDEYDPEALADAKLRKRLMYDQGATKSAMVELQLRRAREARADGVAGQKTVGLEDADAPASSKRMVDGIEVEDIDDVVGADGNDDDAEIASTSAAPGDAPAQDYRSMDYPSLQQYAKEVTGSGAGGKEEIYTRLDAHFSNPQ